MNKWMLWDPADSGMEENDSMSLFDISMESDTYLIPAIIGAVIMCVFSIWCGYSVCKCCEYKELDFGTGNIHIFWYDV